MQGNSSSWTRRIHRRCHMRARWFWFGTRKTAMSFLIMSGRWRASLSSIIFLLDLTLHTVHVIVEQRNIFGKRPPQMMQTPGLNMGKKWTLVDLRWLYPWPHRDFWFSGFLCGLEPRNNVVPYVLSPLVPCSPQECPKVCKSGPVVPRRTAALVAQSRASCRYFLISKCSTVKLSQQRALTKGGLNQTRVQRSKSM